MNYKDLKEAQFRARLGQRIQPFPEVEAFCEVTLTYLMTFDLTRALWSQVVAPSGTSFLGFS